MSIRERETKSARLLRAVIVVIDGSEQSEPETYYNVTPVTETFTMIWDRAYLSTKHVRDLRRGDKPWGENDIHLYSCDMQCEEGDFEFLNETEECDDEDLKDAMTAYLQEAVEKGCISVAQTIEALHPYDPKDVKWIYVHISV